MGTTTARAPAARTKARRTRLAAARERRLSLDPEQMARAQRIDEAVVDIEVAWERRAEAERAIQAEEVTVAKAIERLVADHVSLADIARLTGLDQAVVRRLKAALAHGTSAESHRHTPPAPTASI